MVTESQKAAKTKKMISLSSPRSVSTSFNTFLNIYIILLFSFFFFKFFYTATISCCLFCFLKRNLKQKRNRLYATCNHQTEDRVVEHFYCSKDRHHPLEFVESYRSKYWTKIHQADTMRTLVQNGCTTAG